MRKIATIVPVKGDARAERVVTRPFAAVSFLHAADLDVEVFKQHILRLQSLPDTSVARCPDAVLHANRRNFFATDQVRR